MTTHKDLIRVLMLVATSVATDTRVLREAEALVREGYELLIIGRNVPDDYISPKGITVYSASSGKGLRPSSMGSMTLNRGKRLKRMPLHMRAIRWTLLPLHRARSFQSWADSAYQVASTLEFDLVHSHDYTALALGSRLAAERKLPFIYDSHEWWVGKQRQHRPTPISDLREAKVEQKLLQRAAAVITVGESIADLMRTKRGVKNVYVVRNSFPDSGDQTKKIASPPRGVIYAGRIDAYRELEVIIGVSKEIDLQISWMGERENQWATKFVPLARRAGVEVLSSQPLPAVTTAMQNAGLVFVTHSNQFESHRLAMPNKLFHAIHAGVPVIATDVTELGNIVRQFDIGELYQPGNVKSMAAAILRAISRHALLLENINRAKSELSWERDSDVLSKVYSQVLAEVR